MATQKQIVFQMHNNRINHKSPYVAIIIWSSIEKSNREREKKSWLVKINIRISAAWRCENVYNMISKCKCFHSSRMIYGLFGFILTYFFSVCLYCSAEHIFFDCDDGVSEEIERAGRRWQATIKIHHRSDSLFSMCRADALQLLFKSLD